jgi:hypothetical protein
MAFAKGANYRVADLGLKYRIIVAKLKSQEDWEG